jgi:hypothetical protein
LTRTTPTDVGRAPEMLAIKTPPPGVTVAPGDHRPHDP